MADVSDVENQMVSLIAGFLGLGGSYLQGAVAASSVVGMQCRVYRGWPLSKTLSDDLAAKVANVTVFPVPGAGRRTTRYVPQWNVQEQPTPTLTVQVQGASLTFGGTASTNIIIGVRFGSGSSPATYTYRPAQSDTPLTVAAALGAMIPQSTVAGSVLTLPTAADVETVIAADQTAWKETRRQEQHIWVIGWCPDAISRDKVMGVVDAGFANMVDAAGNLTDQFPLPDGSSARLLYMSNHTDDQAQRAGNWRRDLQYIACYPTTLIETFPTMIFGQINTQETVSKVTVTTTVGPNS